MEKEFGESAIGLIDLLQERKRFKSYLKEYGYRTEAVKKKSHTTYVYNITHGQLIIRLTYIKCGSGGTAKISVISSDMTLEELVIMEKRRMGSMFGRISIKVYDEDILNVVYSQIKNLIKIPVKKEIKIMTPEERNRLEKCYRNMMSASNIKK